MSQARRRSAWIAVPMRRVLNFVYGSTPATFDSSFSLEKSVRRVEAATRRSNLSALASQQAVGQVCEDKVVLQRSIPFVANPYKPIFVGRFERSGSRVVLKGRFTMHWFIKAMLTYCFGFGLVWTALATYSRLASDRAGEWWLPLAGVAMLGVGFSLVWIGKYFARKDVAWLSGVINSALTSRARFDSASEARPRRHPA